MECLVKYLDSERRSFRSKIPEDVSESIITIALTEFKHLLKLKVFHSHNNINLKIVFEQIMLCIFNINDVFFVPTFL